MKNILLLVGACCIFSQAFAQNVLLVDDNNLFASNTDTIVAALQNSNYSNFDLYTIATEGVNPDANLLSGYDVVLWYTSTDGTSLNYWFDGIDGDTDLKQYLNNGGRLWTVGQDMLYAVYPVDTTFAPGHFVFDYLGIESYNVQSYGDDGNLGVAQLDLASGAPSYFQNTLTWIYTTAWYVDGVTPRAGATSIYEMGPSSYVFAGEASMLHYVDHTINNTITLTSLFDPALIATTPEITEFLNDGIYYLLNFDAGINENLADNVKLYPNPTTDNLFVESLNSTSDVYEIVSVTGQILASGSINSDLQSIDVSWLNEGIYILKMGNVSKRFLIRS